MVVLGFWEHATHVAVLGRKVASLFASDDERGGSELSGPVASTPIARK